MTTSNSVPIKHTAVIYTIAVATALLSWDTSGAGLFRAGEPEKISLSRDSSKIAFIWSEERSMPVVDAPILKREISICWCDVAAVNSIKSVKVYSAGGPLYGPDPMDFKFSPDSRHLAVFTPNYLSVVNLKSKNLLRLSSSGEKVASFQWLNNEEIGYCVHAASKVGKPHHERTFWRQKITSGPETRSRIYSESIVKPDTSHWPLEYWSPTGRYILFLRSPYRADSHFRLLDVAAGTIKLTFGRPKSFTISFGIEGDSGISWKLDGSETFCLAGVVGEGDNQAFLVNTNTGQIFDCSVDYSKTFAHAPILLPCWTRDGKYVLANDYIGIGGCLIQPRPWKVVPVAKHLAEEFGYAGPYMPIVFALNIPNWVGLNAPELGKSGLAGPPKFAIDYEGRKFVELFTDPGIFACSPNGKHAAVIWRKKKPTLRKLDVTRFKMFTPNGP